MGFESYETQIGDKTLKEEIEDSPGPEVGSEEDDPIERRKKDRVKRRTKVKRKAKENEKTKLEGYSITDSDIQVRRNVLLKEAVKTLATGKVMGLEIIRDEEEALQELVFLGQKECERPGGRNKDWGNSESDEN
ncbi:hypothetical protein V6N11_034048 [Hibiscus sabdariffa]|uniref:Uncharacterized protein n=1 Tax=Hibiscus sabdariffa TaxID=183260 RepID=A0ABR2S184_9ROSI